MSNKKAALDLMIIFYGCKHDRRALECVYHLLKDRKISKCNSLSMIQSGSILDAYNVTSTTDRDCLFIENNCVVTYEVLEICVIHMRNGYTAYPIPYNEVGKYWDIEYFGVCGIPRRLLNRVPWWNSFEKLCKSCLCIQKKIHRRTYNGFIRLHPLL